MNRRYLVRCVDCDFGRTKDDRASAASHQGRHACPECNRGLAIRPLGDVDRSMLRRYNIPADEWPANLQPNTPAEVPADD